MHLFLFIGVANIENKKSIKHVLQNLTLFERQTKEKQMNQQLLRIEANYQLVIRLDTPI